MTHAAPTAALLLALAAPAASGQGPFPQPSSFKPDAATMERITAKTNELTAALAALPKTVPLDVKADVDIYLKAAEWVVRHDEFYQKDSGRQTLTVLDAGLARAAAAKDGKAPWRDVRGKPIVRGYYSTVDGSVQPFSVTIPVDPKDAPKAGFRLEVVLHGRDDSLTEVKFIHAHETSRAKPPAADTVILEPYGRGNNAYRWAGETDVLDAIREVRDFYEDASAPSLSERRRTAIMRWGLRSVPVDRTRTVLRGFSMGGAGTWHIGLHHPLDFSVIGPGAGFTTTHGYVKTLPNPLPDYQERCLRIYDAVDYAENAFNIPVVAYSGEKDPQKAAADNVAAALKGFPEPVRFTHVVAPGLQHQQPPEWQAKLDAAYRAVTPRAPFHTDRVRFVTYTTRYNRFDHGWVEALDRQYEKAVVDSRWTSDEHEVKTVNVRRLRFQLSPFGGWTPLPSVRVDGQAVAVPPPGRRQPSCFFLTKADGKWSAAYFDPTELNRPGPGEKGSNWTGRTLQGPIDDAFRSAFVVVPPGVRADASSLAGFAAAQFTRCKSEWDKFLRGKLPTAETYAADKQKPKHLVLFGTPETNPLLKQIVAKLPITWTADKLVVNGVSYDPATHLPVLIYPNPLAPGSYVVVNSGHTFHAADFKGSNALLYPRLGDWAVLKMAPTKDDPAAAEVVAAGLFDEFWQFEKAK